MISLWWCTVLTNFHITFARDLSFMPHRTALDAGRLSVTAFVWFYFGSVDTFCKVSLKMIRKKDLRNVGIIFFLCVCFIAQNCFVGFCSPFFFILKV